MCKQPAGDHCSFPGAVLSATSQEWAGNHLWIPLSELTAKAGPGHNAQQESGKSLGAATRAK